MAGLDFVSTGLAPSLPSLGVDKGLFVVLRFPDESEELVLLRLISGLSGGREGDLERLRADGWSVATRFEERVSGSKSSSLDLLCSRLAFSDGARSISSSSLSVADAVLALSESEWFPLCAGSIGLVVVKQSF